jgi:hypothetical protein
LSLEPEAGAQCGNVARWDLRGGPPTRAVPTATGAFYRSELSFLARRINEHLLRWAMRKFKRLKRRRSGPGPGSTPLFDVRHGSLLIGGCFLHRQADLWEPDDRETVTSSLVCPEHGYVEDWSRSLRVRC